MNWRGTAAKVLLTSLMAAALVLNLMSCSARIEQPKELGAKTAPIQLAQNISEVSPPAVIQELRDSLKIYRPQVAILSPQPDEVLQDTTVNVRFQVQDLPIFKNPDLGLGPHLHVILDNQAYIAVYDLNEPLTFQDLAPGTHTLRVFASRPWHESFKNEGAYTQTTFHLFTKTQDNNPDPALPLLTYSRPTGTYGAEPIMLDFYLTNAPLHLVAQQNSEDEIADWRIRVTIDGESFVIDRWEPIYLKGFKPGKNWVQLEFLDELGNPVKNAFNNTVRLITYEPKGKDTLSKLIRGELSATVAHGIVEQNYSAQKPVASPEPATTPEVLPPASEVLPEPAATPEVLPPASEVLPEPAATPEVLPPTSKVPSELAAPSDPVSPVELLSAPLDETLAPQLNQEDAATLDPERA
ncbi:hypothetical protein [Microcoleus sp. FACHB-672]|uniref:hypothetical protein n=1 Tax=Microcoleus sp. FACHB-672 TaxID=2692825 RepID=UPI0028157721|nr:hypothetical protein [Microcoleus sp. FACHB-672]